MVEEAAREWECCVNLRFEFGHPEWNSDVRISFHPIHARHGIGSSWSDFGTDALTSSYACNMYLDVQYRALTRGTVLHEFGHLPAFDHDHQSPKSIIKGTRRLSPWNSDTERPAFWKTTTFTPFKALILNVQLLIQQSHDVRYSCEVDAELADVPQAYCSFRIGQIFRRSPVPIRTTSPTNTTTTASSTTSRMGSVLPVRSHTQPTV
ncbi:hypothetical protein QC761_510780 [Podospora bellae-mahoneyi]|uniref:Uncharacterized protein n=1 Tax=Podospora bellae-mahoneyi TaxID=2093777 RepID=A0ABR0FFW2_9PEZI|nr:hypothetical protein QC761_510780 [Podospora bellae-mahoneyi]